MSGVPSATSARTWNDAGALTLNGKPWTASQVSQFLRKPRNAGYVPITARLSARAHGRRWSKNHVAGGADGLNTPGRAPGRKTVRRHLLTGVLVAAVRHYLSGTVDPTKRIAYGCKAVPRVSVRAEHVEPLIYGCGRRPMAETRRRSICSGPNSTTTPKPRSCATEADPADPARRDRRRTRRRAADRRAGQACHRPVPEKLAAIERRQQRPGTAAGVREIPLGTDAVADAVERLSPDRFRAVLDVLMTVTVMPVGKGSHVFNPERVQVKWR